MMNFKLASPPLVCALACSLTLSSCQTTNPYTGKQQNSRSTSGAVIGGIIGAHILVSIKAGFVRNLLIILLLLTSVKLMVRGLETLLSIDIPIF